MMFLKNRYLLIFAIFFFIYLAGNMVFNSESIQSTVLTTEKSDFLTTADLISSTFAKEVGVSKNSTQITVWLNQIETAYPYKADLLYADGHGISAENQAQVDILEEESEAIQAAFKGNRQILDLFNPQGNALVLRTYSPVYDNNQTIQAVLRLTQPHSVAEKNAQQVFRYLKTGWVIMLTITAVVTLLILFITTRPIHSLTNQLDNLPSSQDYTSIPTQRRDDIGRLIGSLNRLFAHFNQQTSILKNETIKRNSILKNMSDGMIIVNEQDIVEEMNLEAQRIFEIDESEAIGLTLVEVVRHHKLIELHHTCKNNRKQESITFETIPNKLFLHAVTSPLPSPLEGYILLVIQDLTRLRHLEMVRKDFVSNVSHELRTPIASIKALAETLSEGAIDDPEHGRRFLSMMENEIDNINQMVQELLELSRIEAGKAVLERVGIEPEALITKACERMQIQTERAGLQLLENCPPNLPMVFADPSKIGQVFINLIHNAIKFSPSNGVIQLSAKMDKNRIIFTIEDEGIGIEPQNLIRIFERFYKEDQARSGQGTGLGLAIAKHIIESHGGKIWAENKSPHGSIFSFTLPIQ
jgi:two-component system, OmpR family, phosphate regulon sensor histidine kinase PhoR